MIREQKQSIRTFYLAKVGLAAPRGTPTAAPRSAESTDQFCRSA